MNQLAGRSWISRRVLRAGEDPDPRFTLANERTFLAWIRTSLALLAGGVAVEAFASELFPDPLRTIIAVSLFVVAMLLSGGSAVRWYRIERAMRHGQSLPLPLIVPLLALVCTLASGVLALIFLAR